MVRDILKSPFFYLFFILTFIYSPILISDQMVSPDAKVILDNLKGFKNPLDYLLGLISLKTVDFQPIRDLTLFLDLIIEKKINFNSFVKINFILWLFIIFTIHRIFKIIFPSLPEKRLLFVISLFAIHPVFTTSVCWAMARKHLLSCLFILLATKESLKNNRSPIFIFSMYFLSIFSQPINLLWPVWLIIKDHYPSHNSKKSYLLHFSLLTLMGLCIWVNSNYYFLSPVYLEIYSAKANELFNFPNRTLALGHYFFQFIFPYWISFNYSLESLSSYIGIIFLIPLVYVILKMKSNRPQVLIWSIFALLPIVIISTDSKLLSDTYLLAPAVGLTIIFLYLTINIGVSKEIKYFLVFFFFIWCFWSFNETFKWLTKKEFARYNFERSPNCSSAFLYARLSFIEEEKISNDLKNYLIFSNCLKHNPNDLGNFSMNEFFTLLIYYIYYESNLSPDSKVMELEKFKKIHFLSYFFLASLKIQQKKFDEANELISQVIQTAEKNISLTYEPVVASHLLPYCKTHKQLNCESFMNFFTSKTQNFFYE